MMHDMLNIYRRETERAMSQLALARVGIVTSYDPTRYAAKVRIQPEDVETGWLPIRSPWSGNGWGMFCPPSIGDEVEVQHQEGGKEAGYISLRSYGDLFRPLPVPAGECWLVHQSGSLLKFRNDGVIEMHAATGMLTSAPVWNHTGPIIVDGYIKATGDIWDNYPTQSYTMAGFRAVYDIHTHIDSERGLTTPPLRLA